MNAWMRFLVVLSISIGLAGKVSAQAPPGKIGDLPLEAPPPPPANLIAATVNGHEILELDVYRGLLSEQPKSWTAARKEILSHLIDNAIVDQYLAQLKVEVSAKDIDDRFAQIQDEAKKSNQDFAEILKKLQLTEPQLRKELHAALRWDKFVLLQGTDKVLLDYFQKNPAMFDGSQTQARHVLVAAKDDAEGQAKIGVIRKGIEDEVTRTMASAAVPGADKIAVEQTRTKALLTAFALAAERESTCPSKKQGGDLGWFPRVGAMVEPFARAAFALQPYQMSEAVKTEFGYHLILAVDRKPGREVKFDDVKLFVAEIYGERLREAILTAYKPRTQIVVNPMKN